MIANLLCLCVQFDLGPLALLTPPSTQLCALLLLLVIDKDKRPLLPQRSTQSAFLYLSSVSIASASLATCTPSRLTPPYGISPICVICIPHYTFLAIMNGMALHSPTQNVTLAATRRSASFRPRYHTTHMHTCKESRDQGIRNRCTASLLLPQ